MAKVKNIVLRLISPRNECFFLGQGMKNPCLKTGGFGSVEISLPSPVREVLVAAILAGVLAWKKSIQLRDSAGLDD